MGQTISYEEYTNNDLINNMIFRKILISPNIENVFRCVERANYTPDMFQRNVCLRMGMHQMKLESQTLYVHALELLSIKPGNKFLNIGCGKGYLNTVIGLLLGPNGINHGIDVSKLNIEEAYQKLDEFKMNSAGIDYYDFCEPTFIEGNVYNLLPTYQYDKIFCPCSFPMDKCIFIFKMIKIGGILVMVNKRRLIKITRRTEIRFKTDDLLTVENGNELIKPDDLESIEFPTNKPLNLQELCRSEIRSILRKCLLVSNPDLKINSKCPINYSSKEKNMKDELPDILSLRVCSLFDVEFNIRKKIKDTFVSPCTLRMRAMDQFQFSKPCGCASGFDINGSITCTESFVEETAEEKKKLIPRYGESPLIYKNDKDVVYNEMMESYNAQNAKYNFVHKRQENKLSILMKNKINDLEIPKTVKCFLNYNPV